MTKQACVRCKQRKIKCEYAADSDACKKCTAAGLADFCTPAPIVQRSRRGSGSEHDPQLVSRHYSSQFYKYVDIHVIRDQAINQGNVVTRQCQI